MIAPMIHTIIKGLKERMGTREGRERGRERKRERERLCVNNSQHDINITVSTISSQLTD